MSTDKSSHASEGAFLSFDAAEKYKIAENATRPYASIMIQKSGLSQLEGEAHIFDLACGTGALEVELYGAVPQEKWGNMSVLGGDVSTSMLEFLEARGKAEGWAGLQTQVVDGTNIQLPPDSYTHLFINFGIFGMPLSTLQTCHSLIRPGGFIAISTWKTLHWYEIVASAIAKLDDSPPVPSYEDAMNKMHMGNRWEDPESVESHLRNAGFEDVETVVKSIRVVAGTAAGWAEAMVFPVKMIGSEWEAGRKEEWFKAIQEHLRAWAEGEFGVDGKVEMDFTGIVGTGRKAA